LNGEPDVTWPGKIKYFALSSGTSESASKYIPITKELLSSITQASIRQLVSATRYDFPAEFYNKGVLMIGGSTELQYSREYGYYAGDLSGISAGRIPKWFEFFYKPGARISKIKDWSEKLEEMVKMAPTWDIGVIVGVPAWVQILLERIVKEYHLNTIHDMWPNLKVYVHSGVAFAPYEKSFEKLFGKKVIYVESYLASEGYIAYQVDLMKRVMQLLVDNGIYFEFVPFNENNFDSDGNIVDHPQTVTLSEVEENVDYALLLSTCAGSWRYLIGDTVRFLNKEHCEIAMTGRTKQFLSITGEHLSQDNMNTAIEMLSNELDVNICEFSVAGIRHDTMYAHHWYIGTDDKLDPQVAIKKIDEYLCKLNDDYAVERMEAIKDLFIDVLPTHVFYDFMEQKIGKVGGATKFPRVMKGARLEMWESYLKGLK
jgi:GH3 auxin-responsive promoter.